MRNFWLIFDLVLSLTCAYLIHTHVPGWMLLPWWLHAIGYFAIGFSVPGAAFCVREAISARVRS